MVAVMHHPATKFATRLWRIITLRRVPGMAAEAAFWLVFSLPWLLLGVANIVGMFDRFLPADALLRTEADLLDSASDLLSPEVVEQYVEPLVAEVFSAGSAGISVISLLVALWAGSRSIQTFVEANLVINGEFRTWGYLKVRLLAIAILLMVAIIAGILVPATSVGPEQIGQWWGWPAWLVSLTTQVLAGSLLLLLLAAVLTYSLPKRPTFRSSLPGALFAVLATVIGSVFLGIYVRGLFDDASVYGVLAAPIAVLVYAYGIALVTLIGEALNAALRGVDVPSPQRGAGGGSDPTTPGTN